MSEKTELLFVDDDPNVLSGLKRLLRRFREQWTVHCVDSPAAAIQLLKTRPIDVIVSDMRMPDMDGSELLQHVAQNHPGVFRVVLSGQSELNKICRVVDVAHQYLSKPCDSTALENIISHVSRTQRRLVNEELTTFIAQLNSIPCRPENYEALGLALASENDEIAKVSAIVTRDLGLATKVVQLVNTSFFGQSSPCCSPAEACRILGTELLQRLFVNTNVFQASNDGNDDSQVSTATNHSFGGAAFDDPASLARCIGKRILDCFDPQSAMKIEKLIQQDGYSEDQAEETLFGNTSSEVGAYLLALWGFHESISADLVR